MDPATLLIFCFIASAWLQKGWNDGRAISKGIEPPRWTKAKARAAASGRRPFREYLSELWGSAIDEAGKRHRVRHGERFDRWKARRAARADRRSARLERRAARRAERAVAPASPPQAEPATQAPAAADPPSSPVNDSVPPKPAPAPEPSTTGAAPPMSQPVNVPPSGEINDLPTLVARTREWRKFHEALGASGDSSQVGAQSWQRAAQMGITSVESSLALLTAPENDVSGPVIASFTAAKEKLTVMEQVAGQLAALYGQLMEANTSAREAFEAAQREMPGSLNVRQAYEAAPGAGSKKFVTSGG